MSRAIGRSDTAAFTAAASPSSSHDPTASATEDHARLIERAFTRQASAFEDSAINRIFTSDAAWMFERLLLRRGDLLLDVAAGTGHAARSLASSVRCAVAVDVTDAMLVEGKAHCDRAGVDNVLFLAGQATALAFLDDSFDVVVTRFALHHVQDPEMVIKEMARCLRPGGRLAIGDIVAADQPDLAASQNRLERLRDPSHTRMLPVSELCDLVAASGLGRISSEVREVDRPFAPWLDQAETDEPVAAEIRAALRAELAGGPETGLEPRMHDGQLRFVQRWASVIAVRDSVQL